jgi:4-aminobutyrate aminotransferase-like enzyme
VIVSDEFLPQTLTAIPGPGSRHLAQRLAGCECPDTTFLSDAFPVFWERAVGSNVWDVDGNRYVDLTAAFGVCTLGHAHPEVAASLARQAPQLLHAMGDVHPTRTKVELAERLARLAPGDLGSVIFGLNGSDAIEAALKTAVMATGKPGVVAFAGAYHGLGYGALALTWRDDFRQPFAAQLNPHVHHLPFPAARRGGRDPGDAGAAARVVEQLDTLLARDADIGCVVVEPIQGRGGCLVPHSSFLPGLRDVCTRRNVLLVLDEIMTGLGRTGAWFATQDAGVVPDLLCVGKSLAGGMPLSVCLGRPDVMQAWGRSQGEARHTSTFLGHPLACAAALCQLEILERDAWIPRIRERGQALAAALRDVLQIEGVSDVRGRGWMWGIELVRADGVPDAARTFDVVCRMLQRGFLILGSGTHKNVLQLTPPFVLAPEQLRAGLDTLQQVLADTA